MNKPTPSETFVTIAQIGDAMGIILPDEVIAALRAGPGDKFDVSVDAGGLHLKSAKPGFAEKMAVADEIMREDRDILHVLAQ